MGIFSRFEGRMEDGIEGAANKVFDAPISPVQISKKAERAMRREKMVGAGRQYAPTLYTVLVNPDDDQRLFGYYPTLAGETETYLAARAAEEGLVMDGQPLVRFIVDEELRHGKFDVIAEMVSAPIIAQLRQEEMARYGLAPQPQYARPQYAQQQYAPQRGGAAQGTGGVRQVQQVYAPQQAVDEPQPQARPARKEPLPYVPEEEIDRSIDYGEYTFNSQDFESYERDGASYTPTTAGRETYGRRVSQPLEQAPAQRVSADLSGLDVSTYDPYVNSANLRGASSPVRPAPQAARPVSRPSSAPAPSSQPVRASQPVGAAAVPARLVNTATNRAFALTKSIVSVGRANTNDVILDDINTSRNHAQLRFEPQGFWTITDLGSTNGTYVNGQRVKTVPLSEGDRISAGMTDLVFTMH